MVAITEICGREILDSRGNPTVEVEVMLEDGSRGIASAPSGASCGSLEAFELRDNDKSRFHGKGVTLAVNNVNNVIYRTLNGMESTNQALIDQYLIDLDGTKNKSNLGANAIIATSLAIAKASAISLKMPLYQYIGGVVGNTMPVPMANIINGGAHADNNIDIQEFMIMPFTAKNTRDAVRICSEIFHKLKEILKQEGHNVNVGDEGGFAPNLDSTKAALDYIVMSISECGYKPGSDVMLALDAASTEFYHDGKYHLKGEKKILSYKELTAYYLELAAHYPIFSIEDAMSEADYDGWRHVTEKLGSEIQLVGDDLFVTNKVELRKGIDNKMANAILIKPNQIGTLTETIETILLAKSAGYNVIISHRSGETEDTTLAHIAVATNAGQIKTGSLSRTDRIAKYNELMRIEDRAGFSYKKLETKSSVND